MVYNEQSDSDEKFDGISEIIPGKENIHLKVMVVRVWKVPAFLNPYESSSVEMVLVDKKVIYFYSYLFNFVFIFVCRLLDYV
jgi:hypothetical protein